MSYFSVILGIVGGVFLISVPSLDPVTTTSSRVLAEEIDERLATARAIALHPDAVKLSVFGLYIFKIQFVFESSTRATQRIEGFSGTLA